MNEFVKRRPRGRPVCGRRLFLFAGALIVPLAFSVHAGDDDDDDAQVDERGTVVEVVNGRTRLHLDPDTLDHLGIDVGAPTFERHVAERLEFGETLDSAAILAARNAIERAGAARDAAAALVDGQRALIARVTAMREQGLAVDTIALAREQRQFAGFVADQRRAQLALETARQTARLQWGPEFGARIAAPGDPVVDELLAGGHYMISVPVRQVDAVNNPVFVGRSGARANAVAGTWMGPDARNRAPLGTSYLVSAADPHLRSGMRVSIWLTNPGAAFDGLRVPRRALVWHAGSRWIYVELEPGVFERRLARVAAADEHAVLIEQGTEAIPRVVVTGAPSLLGEEFRWSIPDEDDD
jgi:hypothetical protein